MTNFFERLDTPVQTKVVISRHWDNPQITVTVDHEKIALFADVNSFVNAILQEVGNPLFILTRAQLKDRIGEAAKVAIEKIKESSIQVM